jgi:hypothetical protein
MLRDKTRFASRESTSCGNQKSRQIGEFELGFTIALGAVSEDCQPTSFLLLHNAGKNVPIGDAYRLARCPSFIPGANRIQLFQVRLNVPINQVVKGRVLDLETLTSLGPERAIATERPNFSAWWWTDRSTRIVATGCKPRRR